MRYVYSVIRYVPSPISGEFVNIGVIAGNDQRSDWFLRQATDATRARRFGPKESLDAAFALMNTVGSSIDALDYLPDPEATNQVVEPSEAWLRELGERHRNVIQFTPPAPVEAESAADAADTLFAYFIGERVKEPTQTVTRARAFHSLRRAYLQAGVNERMLRQRTELRCNALHTPMDFAVGNGRVVQLAHSWSFQISSLDDVSRDVKAWGYALQALRGNGGEIAHANTIIPVSPDVDVEVLCIEPRNDFQAAAFAEATQVFDDVHASVRAYSAADEIAAIAAKQISSIGT